MPASLFRDNMNDNEFEAPPLIWAAMPIVGGVATGMGLILCLGWLGTYLSPKPHSNPKSASEKPAHVEAPQKKQPASHVEAPQKKQPDSHSKASHKKQPVADSE